MSPSTTALINRQQEIFRFIESRIDAGCPPTVREIGDHFQISSPNGVTYHLKALRRKRLIRVQEFISRGIVIVRREELSQARARIVEAAIESTTGNGDVDDAMSSLYQAVEEYQRLLNR